MWNSHISTLFHIKISIFKLVADSGCSHLNHSEHHSPDASVLVTLASLIYSRPGVYFLSNVTNSSVNYFLYGCQFSESTVDIE